MTTGLKLVSFVWENQRTTAWRSLNSCMFSSLYLAIGSNMEWKPSDLQYILENFRPGYWIGENGWNRAYSLAVSTKNDSFVKAYETWADLKPYFGNGVNTSYTSEFTHRSGQSRQRTRIVCGADIMIDGKRFECTSLNNSRIVLASRDSKNRSVRSLTHEDCESLWPAPKKKKPIAANKGK